MKSVFNNQGTKNSHSEWKKYFFTYGILGLGSCFTLIEPAPFELIGTVLLMLSILRNKTQPWSCHFDRYSMNIFGLVILFWILQVAPIAVQTDSFTSSAVYACVTIFLMAIGMHIGYLSRSSESRFKAFIVGYCVAAVFSSIISIISMHPAVASLGGDVLLFAGRPKGLFKDPNVLAPYIVPAVFILFVQARKNRGFANLFMNSLALICMAGVVVAASRAAWMNLAVVMCAYLLASTWRERFKIVRMVLLATVLLCSLASFFINYEALEGIVDLYNSRMALQNYDSDRFSSAEAALQIGLENPLGVGAGEILSHLNIEPHNTYLKIWSENGQISLFLFIGILMAIGIRGYQVNFRDRQPDIAIILGYALLVGSLINAAVIDVLHWRHFWVIFGYTIFSSGARVKFARSNSSRWNNASEI